MAAEGMQSHDQSCGNCPTASHPATKKGRINAPILPKPARCAKSDRLLAHTLGMDAAIWRALAKCHNQRNLAEYEGRSEDDEQLLSDLIRCTTKLEAAIGAVDPPDDA